ncbi:MAG TPA: AtpZ/AtpI family protein [Acidimicrobiales bacterium]|jgi:F0F1-type ATP synthase assembly protein I|nr:AtpZ/AtpI family protein [Acidimicrobiales bacterium]
MSGTGADEESAQPDDGRYPGPMAYAGLGMLNAVCLLGGCILGWLADRALGTLPLFLFVGLVGGAAVGVLGTRAELRRYNR